MLSSPVSSTSKSCADRMPEIRRVVVPEFPQSKTAAVNHDLGLTLAKLDGDTHTSEAADRRETVRTIQEAGHVSITLAEGTQHDGAM